MTMMVIKGSTDAHTKKYYPKKKENQNVLCIVSDGVELAFYILALVNDGMECISYILALVPVTKCIILNKNRVLRR